MHRPTDTELADSARLTRISECRADRMTCERHSLIECSHRHFERAIDGISLMTSRLCIARFERDYWCAMFHVYASNLALQLRATVGALITTSTFLEWSFLSFFDFPWERNDHFSSICDQLGHNSSKNEEISKDLQRSIEFFCIAKEIYRDL